MRTIHRPQLLKSRGIYRVLLQCVWQNAYKKVFASHKYTMVMFTRGYFTPFCINTP